MVVLALIMLAGFAQMVSVASIFPFLRLAGDPDSVRQWNLEFLGLGFVKQWSNNQILLAAGILSVTAILFSNAVTLFAEVWRIRYAYQFGAQLRVVCISAMAHQPYNYFLEHNSGNLLRQIGETQQFTSQVFLPLLQTLARIVTIICLIGLVVYVSPLGFVCVVGLALIYTVIFRTFKKFRKRLGQKIRKSGRGSTRTAQQLLGGIKTIKVAEKTDFYVGAFEEHVKLFARCQPYVSILANTPRYLIETLVFGSLIGFIVVTTWTSTESLTSILPAVSVLAVATYRLLPAAQQIFAAMSIMQTMLYTLDDMEELGVVQRMEQKSDSADGNSQIELRESIELQKVSFSYANTEKPAISSVDLSIPRNSTVGIMGATGSGKSTLVDILLGLQLPDDGKILVDGSPLNSEDLSKWRRSIGYVPQSIYLVDDTISANIGFGLADSEIDHERVRQAADAAQISSFIESELADGFDTIVGERGVRLSGGQIQRIGIARALYHDPQLLIFDEATSALDSATEKRVVQSIDNLVGKKTMIIIAHRLSTLRNCDFLIELDHGSIVKMGSYNELVQEAN